VKTYNDIYISTRKQLKAAGIEAFGLEARLLVSSAAGKTQEQFLRDINLYINDEFEQKVEKFTEERINGKPIAYITGEWEFYGIPLEICEDVLIPRVDTEVLVDKAVEILKGRTEGRRVLDLCTGSGCIGIAIANNVPDSKVILVDKSIKAMRVSRANVLKNKLFRSVTCIDADAMANPPMLLGRFDMIVCNPPYIPTADIETLDVSVKDYEPIMALDGGTDGLDFYRSVVSKWKVVLKRGGSILFECGIDQAEDVKKIMAESGFVNIDIIKDTMEIDRVVMGYLY